MDLKQKIQKSSNLNEGQKIRLIVRLGSMNSEQKLKLETVLDEEQQIYEDTFSGIEAFGRISENHLRKKAEEFDSLNANKNE